MFVDESFESIQQLQGSVKAVELQTDKIFIELQNSENGMTLVEKELEHMGFPFQYNTVSSPTTLLPLSIRIASLLAIRNVFRLNDEGIKDMGRLATKSSFFTKLTLRYLISLSKMAKEIPRHWQRHYTIGSMDYAELHLDEQYFFVRLREFNGHPIFCTYLSGYIIGVVELIGDFPHLTVQETKCQCHGDAYHEFKVSWIENKIRTLNGNG
jgi:predicted hydrocarbon binding protein